MPDVQQQPITSQGIGGGGVLGASLLRSDPIVPATMASYMFVNNRRGRNSGKGKCLLIYMYLSYDVQSIVNPNQLER